MALRFVPHQYSSPPVNECLCDALAPVVSLVSVHIMDLWKHLSTHIKTSCSLQQIVHSIWCLTAKFYNLWYVGQPCPYWARHEMGFPLRRMTECIVEWRVCPSFQTAETVCVVLNAAIPLDWMDRSFWTAAVPNCVCQFTSTVSHFIVPLFQCGTI